MAECDAQAPVVVVGRGLIGGALRASLLAARIRVITIARSAEAGSVHRARDLRDEAGRVALGADLRELRPRCVVLAHGPSDVTWIEHNAEQAAMAHCGVAEVVAESAVRSVLVSTDNVFSGVTSRHRPSDPIDPGNAYGRVKAQAERLLFAGGNALALRVSLVYGWVGSRYRSGYAERCLRAAFSGQPLLAPTDQDFTPVHIDDVARLITALCLTAKPIRGIRHIAGPTQLSRYEFARLAYQLTGANPELVRPCLRADTEWASRPRYSSLACDAFTDVEGLADWRSRTPAEGLRVMLADQRRPQPQLGAV